MYNLYILIVVQIIMIQISPPNIKMLSTRLAERVWRLKQFCADMNMPNPMTKSTFNYHACVVKEAAEKVAIDSMETEESQEICDKRRDSIRGWRC